MRAAERQRSEHTLGGSGPRVARPWEASFSATASSGSVVQRRAVARKGATAAAKRVAHEARRPGARGKPEEDTLEDTLDGGEEADAASTTQEIRAGVVPGATLFQK